MNSWLSLNTVPSPPCPGARITGCAIALALLALTGCEVKNPITENSARPVKSVARATPPATPTKAPAAVDDIDVKKPVGLDRAQINARIKEAMRQRGAVSKQGSNAPSAPPALAAPPTSKAPERPLTSKDFTTLTPDGADTARESPTAEDLERYVSDLKGKGALRARIVTNMGEIDCELYEEGAPITVANFVGLARGLKAWIDPFTNQALSGVPLYQNVLFHRVIPGFMIQGGDPQGTGRGNPGYRIIDEFDKALRHDSGGILSMANAGKNTGGSQFFVTSNATPNLDDRHTVFGKCEDFSTVNKIAAVPTIPRDKPKEDVIIEKIEVYRAKK